MNRRRLLIASVVTLGSLLFAQTATAQSPPPLTATIFFKNPPPNLTFDPTLPSTTMTIILQLENTSGAAILTTEGFSSTDFWRKTYFTNESGGTATNTAEATIHGDARVGFCLSRQGVLQVPTAIPVVPAEVLVGPPAPFSLEFTINDVFTRFPDLKSPGRWTGQARIPILVYTPGDAIITDCDQFPGVTLVNVGDAVGASRQALTIVSNGLEFLVPGNDTTPPTTTVLATPTPNGAGWSNQAVALTLTATDNPGGSGVNRIEAILTGAQIGTQTITGASGIVSVTAEGTTTVTFNAVDNGNNAEATQSLTVRIDKTLPVVTPPANATVTPTEAGGARGSASPALAALLGGGSALDNLDPSPARLAPQVGGVNVSNSTLFPLGTTTVTFRFQDQAGNIGSATAAVTVAAIGSPTISGAIVGKGVQTGVRYYDLRFTNTGTDTARNLSLNQLLFRTLSGTGAVTYNTSLSPALPDVLGDLAVGTSTTVRVFLNVPSTVTRFSITENGQVQNTAGTNFTFSIGQATFP